MDWRIAVVSVLAMAFSFLMGRRIGYRKRQKEFDYAAHVQHHEFRMALAEIDSKNPPRRKDETPVASSEGADGATQVPWEGMGASKSGEVVKYEVVNG